jgi:hypothetical protein
LFATPFGVPVGHITCGEILMVDPTKVVVIVNPLPPKTPKEVNRFLKMTGYYIKLIGNYAAIVAEELTNKKRGFDVVIRVHASF